MAEFLDFDSVKTISQTIRYSKSKEIILSKVLFYFLLKHPKLHFILYRALLHPDQLKEKFKKETEQIELEKILLESLKSAILRSHSFIGIQDLFCGFIKLSQIFKQILIENNLKLGDIIHLAEWEEALEKRIKEREKFWKMKNLMMLGSIGKDWAAGYTVTLDKFSIDLGKVIRKRKFPQIIGHRKELEAMERILGKGEINNVLIIGEPGSGRESLVWALAEKSLLGESLPELNYKRFIKLNLHFLLAQLQNPEVVENVLDKIFREVVRAGNVILIIDHFHEFIGRTFAPGVIDISGVIGPYLQLPEFKLIAITSFEGLHKNLERNPSILALFEKIEVPETTPEETLALLENLALKLEHKHKILISYPAIRDILILSKKYLPAIPFPEKALRLLDEIVVQVIQRKEKIVLPKHVAKIVYEKTKIPVGELERKEREILLNLEKLIHQRIIDQEEAVSEISSALRRARTGITTRKGPMGCFLFLGPTGVGKTETSKALAQIYFGSEERMIRLDMSEFQNIKDIKRLIGSINQEGLLTTQVRENPFSLILLDEIEKAHPNILNLFLQVLDEGHLTDGLGRKVDFKNTIIIATSNAGYQIILEAIKEKIPWKKVKQTILDFLFKKGIFRPEFVNRFDAVVIFKPLTKENLLNIAELLLKKLAKKLKEKEIEFLITDALKEKIVDLGYDPKFGAREMRRIIQRKIENTLAKAILKEEVKRGDRIEIDPQTFKIKKFR